MKSTRPGGIRFPRLYQTFASTQEIADVINRSRSYVKKALKTGFTDREAKMLENYTGNKEILKEGSDL